MKNERLNNLLNNFLKWYGSIQGAILHVLFYAFMFWLIIRTQQQPGHMIRMLTVVGLFLADLVFFLVKNHVLGLLWKLMPLYCALCLILNYGKCIGKPEQSGWTVLIIVFLCLGIASLYSNIVSYLRTKR